MVKKSIKFLVYLFLAVPAVALIRLCRPLVLFRFAVLISPRIGHFAGNTEIYLCKKDLGLCPRRVVDIFYFDKTICNQQLAAMWRRQLLVLRFAAFVNRVNHFFPGWEAHEIPELGSDRDPDGLLMKARIHLVFSEQEQARGRHALSGMGVKEGAPFVCFTSRNKDYLQKKFPGREWAYLDYRNTDIADFMPGVEELVSRGYKTLRMGAIVEEPLKTVNKGIVDYAPTARSDFMDVYLLSTCSFYLADTCGLAGLPMAFRRPMALTNIVPLEHVLTWVPNLIFIPKKLWLIAEKRFMTFAEIFLSPLSNSMESDEYRKQGVEVVNNTPAEIRDLAVEMEERLRGVRVDTEEDRELQQQFWSQFKVNDMNRVFRARIGADFIRQNSGLLGGQWS